MTAESPNLPWRHHYVPQSYLQGWTGADGELCEYRRVTPSKIVVRRSHPAETGWKANLYTLDLLPPDEEAALELQFFMRVDNDAAAALTYFRGYGVNPSDEIREGWARFLMSMIFRNPRQVDRMRDLARQHLTASLNDPEARSKLVAEIGGEEKFEAFLEEHGERIHQVFFGRALQQACDSPRIGPAIASMNQQLIRLDRGERLLTSDRPLLRAYGLADAHGFLAMPIAPRLLWVGTNGPSAEEVLRPWTNGGALAPTINRLVARQAHQHVYGVCENHRPLVEAEMGAGLELPWRTTAGVYLDGYEETAEEAQDGPSATWIAPRGLPAV